MRPSSPLAYGTPLVWYDGEGLSRTAQAGDSAGTWRAPYGPAAPVGAGTPTIQAGPNGFRAVEYVGANRHHNVNVAMPSAITVAFVVRLTWDASTRDDICDENSASSGLFAIRNGGGYRGEMTPPNIWVGFAGYGGSPRVVAAHGMTGTRWGVIAASMSASDANLVINGRVPSSFVARVPGPPSGTIAKLGDLSGLSTGTRRIARFAAWPRAMDEQELIDLSRDWMSEFGLISPRLFIRVFDALAPANANVNLSLAPTLTVAAEALADASASFSLSPTLTVIAEAPADASASLSLAPTLVVTAEPLIDAAATLSLPPTLVVAAAPEAGASASLDLGAELVVTAEPVPLPAPPGSFPGSLLLGLDLLALGTIERPSHAVQPGDYGGLVPEWSIIASHVPMDVQPIGSRARPASDERDGVRITHRVYIDPAPLVAAGTVIGVGDRITITAHGAPRRLIVRVPRDLDLLSEMWTVDCDLDTSI